MFLCHSSGAAARGLPVFLPVTEDKATPETFVLNVKGVAGANEIGAGGGVPGADQVLTQFGGLAGVVDGFRQVAAGRGLACTAALLAALLNGEEWTMMFYLRGLAFGANINRLNYLQGTAILDFDMEGTGHWCPQIAGYTNAFISNMTTLPIATPSSNLWAALWRKAGNTHFGFTTAGSAIVPPTGWDSIPELQRSVAVNCGNYSGETWGTLRDLIGYSTTNTTYGIGSIVISKIGLQAAPV
ncbi:MAG: hypothetical protein KKF77_04200 [Proteobacteria bacterium]|nr:hypothetical protein [Pseudomonadota bacterium]